MTKFYKLTVIILISYYFSFVITRLNDSPRTRRSGRKVKVSKTDESTKDIYPEKEYWTPPKNIGKTARVQSFSEEKPSHDFKRLGSYTPIGLLTDSHIDGLDLKPKKRESKQANKKMTTATLIRESQKLKQEVSSEAEDAVWTGMESWAENKNKNQKEKIPDFETWKPKTANKNIKMWKENYLETINENGPDSMEDKDYDDVWKEDNSMKEILRWRDKPAEIRNDEIVWKKRYTQIGNTANDKQNAKDTRQVKEKKSEVVEPKGKATGNKIRENKARVQERQYTVNSAGQPKDALPTKEFDVGNIFDNETTTKIKEMVEKELNSLLQDKDTRLSFSNNLRDRRHSKKLKSRDTKVDNKSNSKTRCIEKCFTSKCEVECVGRQASAACSADSCSATTKGQDSASLCNGQLCHAMCFHTQCIAACEGPVCFGKCDGDACHAMSKGRSSQTICSKDECMANAFGDDVHAKCTGKGCQAQCVGANCAATCEGKKCVAECSGKKCTSRCEGKDCQHAVHTESGKLKENKIFHHDPERFSQNTPKDEDPDDGHYGNKDHDKKIINKAKNEDESGGLHINFNSKTGEPNDENVKLDYSIGINLNDKLTKYLKFELEQLKNTALLRQLPKLF